MEYRRVKVISLLNNKPFMKSMGLNVLGVAKESGVKPRWLNNVKNEDRCSADSDMVDRVYTCLVAKELEYTSHA